MAKEQITKQQRTAIAQAIGQAELNTSGEIRVHVESRCKGDVLDRAADVFAMLKMHRTDQRNGVLFYLALADHKIAILGDAGINAVVPQNFWESIKDGMLPLLAQGNHTEALVLGIAMAGEKLKEFFPYRSSDVNEMSNEVSFQP